MKIVVPVDNDKKTVFKKVGRAPFFNIYEDKALIDSVVNNHASSHHEEHEHSHDDASHVNEHKKDIQTLVGCDVILVQAIGEHMSEALESIGLKVLKLRKADGVSADEVVEKFLNNSLVNQLKDKPKRLIFPTNENMGYLSKRGAHFGKAKYYTLVTLNGNDIADVEVIENKGHSAGACGSAVSNITSLHPDALIVSGIGASPAKGFANAGLDVYYDESSQTVKDSIDMFVKGSLEKVSKGTCSHH